MSKVKTSDLEKALKHASTDDLSSILDDTKDQRFEDVFEQILTARKMNKGEVIKNTLLDRTYAYQILNGDRNGSKDKIVQLCIASQCNVEETNRLLTLSKNPKLYAKTKRDSLIIFSINNQYSVMETNELLNQYGQTILD